VSLPPESIQVGQCYLTNTGLVRRVIAFHQGKVLYETRVKAGSKNSASGWIPGIIDPKVFAALLERPVPCDWTPETGEP
jgi:hypothetical protein